jgi:hypothetical protein
VAHLAFPFTDDPEQWAWNLLSRIIVGDEPVSALDAPQAHVAACWGSRSADWGSGRSSSRTTRPCVRSATGSP